MIYAHIFIYVFYSLRRILLLLWNTCQLSLFLNRYIVEKSMNLLIYLFILYWILIIACERFCWRLKNDFLKWKTICHSRRVIDFGGRMCSPILNSSFHKDMTLKKSQFSLYFSFIILKIEIRPLSCNPLAFENWGSQY